MDAACSLPDPVKRRTVVVVPEQSAGPLVRLAAHWSALGPAGAPAVADRLATVLRQLGATLRAEPFWPLAARSVGAEMFASGLCGDPADPAPGVEDVLARSLGLLRREAPATLGISGAEGEQRLAAALDEIAAGFAGALLDSGRSGHPRPVPSSAVALVGGLPYRAVYDQAYAGIVIGSLEGDVLAYNPAMGRMLGIEGPMGEPLPVSDFVHPDDLADVVERYLRLVRGEADVVRLEVRLVRPDSQVVWVSVVVQLVRGQDGAPSHLMAVVEDVTARLPRSRLQVDSAQNQLHRLPGRGITEQWLRRAFADGGAKQVGVCILDLDGFHAVNDALGGEVGDRLLLGVVGRLQFVAGEHLVTRTDGDEFAVLVADPDNTGDVCRLADRLQAALATPFLIGGHTVSLTTSIGVAESPTAGACPDELMRSADIARSWAKALGGGRRVVFDHERDTAEAARFGLIAGLRGAIDRGEFRLDYQPLVRLTDGRLRGVEALVRWQHPEHGLIGPGRFIELAEKSGAIVPLGQWVLEEACRQAAVWWRELGAEAPFVSVNVSPVQLVEPGWVGEVVGALAATGLPSHRLQLEITEQAVLGDEAVVLDALTALRAVGVRLALDDFGTGYSSLGWLRRLPVHALKIDGSFIDGLRHPVADPVDTSIVRALVQMAHALALEVTAEWVETSVQAERLAALGCDVGQGRWFGDAGPGEWVPGLWRRSIDH